MREQQPVPAQVTDAQITAASNQIRALLTENPALLQTALNWQQGGTRTLLGITAARTTLGAVAALTRANLPGGSLRGGAMAAVRGAAQALRNPVASARAAGGAAMRAVASPKKAAADLLGTLPIMEPISVIKNALAQGQISLLLANKAFQGLVTNPAIMVTIQHKPAQVATILLAGQFKQVATREGAEQSLSALVTAAAQFAQTSEFDLAVKNLMTNQAVMLDPAAPAEAKSAARLKSAEDIAILLSSTAVTSLMPIILEHKGFLLAALEPIVGPYLDTESLVQLITDPDIRADLVTVLREYAQGQTMDLLGSQSAQRLIRSPVVLAALAKPPAPSVIADFLLAGALKHAAPQLDGALQIDWSADGLPLQLAARQSLTALVTAAVESVRTLPASIWPVVTTMTKDRAISLDPNAAPEAKSAAVRRLAGSLSTLLNSSEASIESLAQAISENRAFVEAVLEPFVGQYIAPGALIPLLTNPNLRVGLTSALEAFSSGGTSALLRDESTQSLLTSDAVLSVLAIPPAPGAIADALLGRGGALEYVSAQPGAQQSLKALILAFAQSAKAPEVAASLKSFMTHQATLLDSTATPEAKSAAYLPYIADVLAMLGSKQAGDLSKAIQSHQEFVAAALAPVEAYVSAKAVARLAAEPGTCADLSNTLHILSVSGAMALLRSQAAQRVFTSSAVLNVLSTPPAPGVIADTLLGGALKHVAKKLEAKESLLALLPALCEWVKDEKAGSQMVDVMSKLGIFFDDKHQPAEDRSRAVVDAVIGVLKLLADKPDSLNQAIETHKQFIADALRPHIGIVKPETLVSLLRNKKACAALAQTLSLYRNNHEIKAIARLVVEAIKQPDLRKVVFSAIANVIASALKRTKKDVKHTAKAVPKPPRDLPSGNPDKPAALAA